MINAEKAAYLAPAFQSRRTRALKSLLQHIDKKYFAESRKAKGTALVRKMEDKNKKKEGKSGKKRGKEGKRGKK